MRRLSIAALTFMLLGTLTGCGQFAVITKDAYLDKCKGAWAGQMIGVCYGDPYQFRFNGEPILEALRDWKPEMVAGATRQDDVYVELTFLGALERHGLDITPEQAGRAFADTPYPLWHANLYGRLNVRNGILPPLSGCPRYNRHADDIDFQIESDLFGIICPGLPAESNRLCNIFGHIMNYGDGVYGGMFVAGMYTAAYFEANDVLKVIQSGMACIPQQSTYHQCIADTVRWCRQYPNDWLETWRRVEARWNDDVDCIPGNPHNIDAKLNGAYIVIGLMYGSGDPLKTLQACMRCGQDADSSTANAGGIIGCMKGYTGLGPQLTAGIPAIADAKFLGTEYSFNTLSPACLKMAEATVRRCGGKVTGDEFLLVRQPPRPPLHIESWPNKAKMIREAVTQHEIELWDKQWKQVPVTEHFEAGFYPREYGRTNVLQLMPLLPGEPVALQASLKVPDSGQPKLRVELASDGQHGDYTVRAFADNRLLGQETIRTGDGEFVTRSFDLPGVRPGATVYVRLEFRANSWAVGSAFVRKVEIR
jgi:hypothetical protein